ncbi:MAG TPA: ABC transporter ATP-binding protein [Rhizobiales bacterium]|nr:ABC transporter ATP-binding protein [Hyphomicrobiales bacterium]
MIQLDKVRKIYNEGRENEVQAVRGVSLEIAADRTTVFKGPSGSGKTSLLTLIGCLSRPSSGRVKLNGEIISGLPEKFMTEVRRKTFGFVFQRFNLIRGLKVIENVMLPAYPLGPDHAALRNTALELLEMLDIAHKGETAIEHLSGGEAQRVAIARALINDPAVVIADEPTANLDTRLTAQFLKIIDKLRLRGKTVLMTSHDPRIWQAPEVDTVITMEDGRIIRIEPGGEK